MCINMSVHACTVRVSPEGAEKIEGDGFPAIEHRVCARAREGAVRD